MNPADRREKKREKYFSQKIVLHEILIYGYCMNVKCGNMSKDG